MLERVLAVLPSLPGFINAAVQRPVFKPLVIRKFTLDFDVVYGFAWFVGLGVAMLLYYVLMRGRARPAAEVRPAETRPIHMSIAQLLRPV